MRLPDVHARRDIFNQQLAALPESLRAVEVDRIVDAMEGFTGADIRRTIDDAKSLYAYDRAYESSLRPLTDYFLAAVESVRKNKEQYAAAEIQARQQRPSRPPWFNVGMPQIDDDDD